VLPVSSQGPSDAVRHLASDDRMSFFQQRFSPDQRWISFIGRPLADRSIATVYVIPASGGPLTRVTEGAYYDDKPRWADDGRTIYFISNREGRSNVWGRRFDPATGQPQGEPFRVTAFEETRRTLAPDIGQMDMVITPRQIFLPLHEASGGIWILETSDH
jgi:dipeptidyl aminopeptidase/acylaminoacyl peptidase